MYAGTFQNLFFKIIRLRLSAQKPTKRNEEEEREIDPKWIPLLVCLVDWLKVDSVFFKKALIWSKPFCKWNIQIQHELICNVSVCTCRTMIHFGYSLIRANDSNEHATHTHTRTESYYVQKEEKIPARIFVMAITWQIGFMGKTRLANG